MKKIIELFKRSEDFWIATGIRCLRQFLFVVAGAFSVGTLLTDVDWGFVLLTATSSSFATFIACILAGLPEVDE